MDLHVLPTLIAPPCLPPHPIPLGLPSAPSPSTCLMHQMPSLVDLQVQLMLSLLKLQEVFPFGGGYANV